MKTNLLWVGAGCLMLMLCGVTRASVVTFDPATDTITIVGGAGTMQMPPPSYYRDYDYKILMTNVSSAPGTVSVPPKVTTTTSGTKGSTDSNSGSTSGTKSDSGSGSSGDTNTGTNSGDDNGNAGGSTDPGNSGSTTTGGGSNPTNDAVNIVPLPASWAMAAVGLAGVTLISWRRSRSQAA